MAFINSLEADVVTRMCEHARDINFQKDVIISCILCNYTSPIIFKHAILI